MMSDKPFVHLHVHSEYSLLDGAIRCRELAQKVSSWGMPAVGLTDHGVMYGAVEFYKECLEADIKPIIGCELYVSPDGYKCRNKGKRNYHLLLLAENDEGYHNLVKLVSIANTDGFYYKPRIDHDLLSQYNKGLIVASACLAGEIPQLIIEGKEVEALERAMMYRDIVGKDNFFLEVQHNGIPEQALVNKALVRMARKHDFPLIATNDAHYLNAEDYDWHEILLCVGTNATIDQPNRLTFKQNSFYLRSPEEMWSLFGTELPDALTNTVAIAERCNIKLPLKTRDYKLPKYDVPEGETLATTLEKQARAGLRKRLGTDDPPEKYRKRLEYELNIINDMEFPGYFLIIADVIKSCKKNGIPIGPGRGSAAGSLVAYCMRITELDPLKYNLIFERFLNPERVSMPDIDTDVSDKGREDLLKYVVEKYGVENVSQIITFGRMKSKAAIKDVGRALGMPYPDVDRVAKLIPAGVNSIPEAIEQTDELKQLKKEDPQIKRLLESASSMEGLARHCSQHAAGVVITPMPLTDLVPVRKIGENQVVTQFAMGPVEELGLVKMDFLGLQTLSIIEEALANIKESGMEPPDLGSLPMDDAPTFEMLQAGDTLGVFQLESAGMRKLLKRMVPDSFEDLIAILALYRPGPLESGMVDQYVERKHGRSPVVYLHPALEDVLKGTYGVILYQEQVMQCASKLAGFTLGQADLLRRAMGKKKVEVMNEQRVKFVAGAEKNGIDQKKSNEIFDIIQKFAGYGFNKSHSAAYALISYHTAYLKTHYKTEFMAAYLTSQIGAKKDVMASYVKEVRNSGIKVLPPDINQSRAVFTAAGDVIRFGLTAVSKVGNTAVQSILKARENGVAFELLWDFIERIDLRLVNKSVIENLIKAGAFDSICSNRHQLLESFPSMIEYAQKRVENKNQCTLFGEDEVADEHPGLVETEDYDLYEKLEMEKEAVGMYISGHPFERYEKAIRKYSNSRIIDLKHWKSDKIPAFVGGILGSWKEKYTKKGDAMGILELEDGEGKVDVVCFPRSKTSRPWLEIKPLLQIGKPYLVKGIPEDRGGLNIIARDIVAFGEETLKMPPNVVITLESEALKTDSFRNFVRLLKSCPGRSAVLLKLKSDADVAVFSLMDIRVDGRTFLTKDLSKIMPPDVVEVSV